MTAAEVRARLEARVSRPEALPPLSVVGLLTRDRVERVRRALASFRENARRHGRRPSFVVADNSEALSTQAACREALAALRAADPEPPEIRYVGLREREAFVDRLARLGIDPEVARFGLLDVTGCGFAAGANRNALLLATAGERFLSVDDDVVCALAPSPAPAPGIELFSSSGDGYENYNPADFWFFDDRAALERAVHPEDTDALGLHEAVLGRDLGACLSAVAGDPVKLDRFAPRLLERVIARGGQARVTLPGLFGDIGWYAPTWLLLLTGASRERFTGSEAAYESACASRRVLRVVPRPTITDGRFFQSTLLGLDNRVPLPPFMPVQRYEDGVFRIALRACFEDAYFAHLPWAALHDSDEGRRWAREDIWQTAAWIRTGELLVHCVHSYTPSPGADPEERLRALGAHLVSVGELPAADFRAFVRARVVAQKTRYLEHLEALLREHGDAPGVLGARPPPARGHRARRAPHRCLLRPSRPGGQPSGRRARVAAPRRAGRAHPGPGAGHRPAAGPGIRSASPPVAGSRGRDAGAAGSRRGAGRGRGRGMRPRRAAGRGPQADLRRPGYWVGWRLQSTMANVRCQDAPLM